MIDFEERENSSLLPDLAENADVSRNVDLQDAAGGVRLVLMVEAGVLGQTRGQSWKGRPPVNASSGGS